MKRSNPSSGKKTHVPSDFKRLKAKVGKRAPQKANVTETKFQTASVQVRSQNIVDSKATSIQGNADNNGSNTFMVSSKGKQLSQLLSQLNNPSPNVRLSSLQGIKDASKHTHDNILPNYLSVLVPPLSKSMVDEDSKVRKIARSIFFQDISARIIANKDSDKMRPFLPLSFAYVVSALHSLDQDIRYDGCVALEIFCSSFYNDLNGDKELHSLIYNTIPAFAILFDDVSGGISSVSQRGISDIGLIKSSNNLNKNQKSGRKKQSSGTEKALGILRSFISLMKVATLSGQEGVDMDKTWVLTNDAVKSLSPNSSSLLPSSSLPNLMYLPGGMSTNAVVYNQNWNINTEKSTVKLKGLKDLSLMSKLHEAHNSTEWTNRSLTISTQIDLLSKLRNRFVEVTQKGNPHTFGGLSISVHDVDECMLLITSFRLLWKCHPRFFDNEEEANMKFISQDGKKNEWKRFKILVQTLLQMQLDVFPMHDPSGNAANKHKYDLMNASLCCVISEFGSVLDPPMGDLEEVKCTVPKSKWVDSIFSFLIPQLTNEKDDSKTFSPNSSRVTLLKVVEQLLFRTDSGICFLDDKAKQLELLSTFAAEFFPDTEKPHEQLCRSVEGRRATYILISLLAQYFQCHSRQEFYVDKQESCDHWNILYKMTMNLPLYLINWRGCFAKESSLVMSTLISIARRCKEPLNSQFCTSIRESVIEVFTNNTTSDCSVFEALASSLSTQKLAVSLVGVLSYPSESLLSSLARICALHNFSKETKIYDEIEIVEYIMSVVYSIKTTISMEQYADFLIQAVGISNKDLISTLIARHEDENKSEIVCICYIDKALIRTCRYLCLVLHDDDNIFQVLKPRLISWLQRNDDDCQLYHKLKSRAALSIISCWSLLLNEIGNKYILLEKGLKANVLKAIFDLFLSSPDSFRDENWQVVSPIMTLLRLHPDLYCSIVKECIDRIKEHVSDNDHISRSIITNLLYLVKNDCLLDLNRQKKVSKTIAEAAYAIETATLNGPLHMLAGTLVIQAQSIVGFNQSDRFQV